LTRIDAGHFDRGSRGSVVHDPKLLDIAHVEELRV